MLGWWIIGCVNGGPAPRIEARAGGAGYWPPNSRTAVEGAVSAGFDGIELDLVLTRDHVPVLLDDVWIRPEQCTRPDGETIAPILVRNLTLDVLQSRYRCGGVPDPDQPNALVVADTVMTFDEVLDALHDAPAATVVHLDIHQVEGLTARPEVFARQILDRWFAEDLPQALVVTSSRPEVLAAFDSHGRLLGIDVPTDLVFPDFAPGATPAEIALSIEAERWANGLDYVTRAVEAGADGLSIRWEIADRPLIDAARDEGLTIAVWTVDRPAALSQWTVPGKVDAVITNYPGDVP